MKKTKKKAFPVFGESGGSAYGVNKGVSLALVLSYHRIQEKETKKSENPKVVPRRTMLDCGENIKLMRYLICLVEKKLILPEKILKI